MRSRILRLGVVLALSPLGISAQTGAATPQRLSLSEAINLARQNSPSYRQVLNDEGPAAAEVRAAYGGFLPNVTSSLGGGYSRAGRQTLANQIFSQGSSTVSSSYNISASMGISYAQLLAPAQSKAQQRLTEENIATAALSLTTDVTTQYLAALRADASVRVAEQQVERNEAFRLQAQALYDVGRGNLVEVRQAEVAKANADVQLLRARQQAVEARIELLRRMGLPGGEAASLELTEQFQLTEPSWNLAALQADARRQHPQLRAAEAREDAADLGVRSARSAYLPSLGISTGLSGFTQQATSVDPLIANAVAGAQSSMTNCAFQNAILERLTSPHPAPGGGIIPDCQAYAGLDATGNALLPELEQQIRDANSNWPFSFTRQPWSISVGLSLTLFDGFGREARVSQARAIADDAREALRDQRLLIDGQVQSSLLSVETSWRAAEIADANRVAAADQLALATERYRIGSGNALEVTDAQNSVTQAEANYVGAIYDYHTAVALLEAAVGHSLR